MSYQLLPYIVRLSPRRFGVADAECMGDERCLARRRACRARPDHPRQSPALLGYEDHTVWSWDPDEKVMLPEERRDRLGPPACLGRAAPALAGHASAQPGAPRAAARASGDASPPGPLRRAAGGEPASAARAAAPRLGRAEPDLEGRLLHHRATSRALAERLGALVHDRRPTRPWAEARERACPACKKVTERAARRATGLGTRRGRRPCGPARPANASRLKNAWHDGCRHESRPTMWAAGPADGGACHRRPGSTTAQGARTIRRLRPG